MTHSDTTGGNTVATQGRYPNPWEALNSAPGLDPIDAYLDSRPELLPGQGYLVTVNVDQNDQTGEIHITRYDGRQLAIPNESEPDSPDPRKATVDLNDITHATLVVDRRIPGHREGDTLYHGVAVREAETRFLPGSGKTVFVRRGLDQADSLQRDLTQDLWDSAHRATVHRMVATHAEVRDILRTTGVAMWLNEADTEALVEAATQKLVEIDLAHQDRRIDRLAEEVADLRHLAGRGLSRASKALRGLRWRQS
jgi:hypothetical protein